MIHLILKLLFASLLFIGCGDTEDEIQNGIRPFKLLTDNLDVTLSNSSNEPLVLSWERTYSTNNASVFYKILFSGDNKDFTHPIYSVQSDKGGYATSISFSHNELDNIMAMSGVAEGKQGTLYWTVLAESGTASYLNPDPRKLQITRIHSEDINPEVIYWEEAADSLNYVLTSQFLNKEKGIFWGSAQNALNNSDILYWQQAHYIDVLIYAYERLCYSTDPDKKQLAETYKQYFQLWLQNHANNWHTPNSFYNGYTDDMCWMVLTLLHMNEATKDERYFKEAKQLYDNDIITRASDNDGYGWALPWNDQNSVRNACTNNPACIAASLLYKKTQDVKYLEDAKKLYSYIVKRIMSPDGKLETTPLSYTQGTFIEAARLLYHHTNDPAYLEKAEFVMRQTLEAGWSTKNGLLRNEGTSADQSIFKAIFAPYAVNFVLDTDVSRNMRILAKNFLLHNAEVLWKENLDRNKWPRMFCNFYWGEVWSEANENQFKGSTGAHASGCSLIENVARMLKYYILSSALH